MLSVLNHSLGHELANLQPTILKFSPLYWVEHVGTGKERENEKRKRNDGADGVVVLFFLSVYVLFVAIPN